MGQPDVWDVFRVLRGVITMLSHHHQVLLGTLASRSLLERVPLFKQARDERFTTYPQTYLDTAIALWTMGGDAC